VNLNPITRRSKPTEFIGKAAALAEREQGVTRRLCTFEVDARDADAVAWEPIWHDGAVVGYVTSGGYSHYAQKSIAFGFLPLELIEEGRQVEIEILGDLVPARLYTTPLFDPPGPGTTLHDPVIRSRQRIPARLAVVDSLPI
jgi:dimethylglycine dehydrogenase